MNDASEPQQTGRFAELFPSIMLPMFLAIVDQTIVAAALPAIASSLGSVDRVSWIVVAYLLSTTIAAPVYGQLRDVAGSRKMMLIALAVFMGSSLLCAASTSVEMLSFARVLQGFGGGGLMTLSQALIGETIPPRERARYQGYLAAVAVTSSTFGPVMGGFLAQHFGWRSIFLVNIPIGLIAVALVIRAKARPVPKVDWEVDVRGIVYFVFFIVPVLLGVEVTQRLTTGAFVQAFLLLLLGITSLALLLRHERRAMFPLLQMELLKRPAIWRSGLLVICHAAALVALVTWLPIFFRVRFGTSASESGMMLLPFMFGIGIGSMTTGQMVSRTGLTMIFPSVGLVIVVVLLQILSLWAGRLGIPAILILLLLLGLAMGTVMSVMQVTVQRAAGTTMLGAASASVQFSRSVGAAVGTALVGAVLFVALAVSDPVVAGLFRSMITDGPSVIAALTVEHRAVVSAEIAMAFGAAFATISAFSALAMLLAWTHPERKL